MFRAQLKQFGRLLSVTPAELYEERLQHKALQAIVEQHQMI
jgi:hypothetical protein